MKKSVHGTPLLTRNRVLHLCALMMCCLAILAGCARSQGKKSFEFLKAEREILRNTNEELKKCSNPKPPSPPDLSEARNGIERTKAIKEYRVALRHYWNTVQQNSLKAERVLDEAETKISRLDSSGIGDDAINLATDYEHLLGSMVQIQVETKAIAELFQAELQENREAEAARHLMAAALVAAADYCTGGALTPVLAKGAGTFLTGVASDAKRGSERSQELQTHSANLQKVIADVEHYHGEVITKRSELVTSYRAKFPEYDWSSFLPSEEQAAEQTHTSQYEQTAVQAQNTPAISAASELVPKRHQYTGEITSIDPKIGTIVVEKLAAESKTFKIGEKTKYSTVDKKDAVLADIKVGDKVTVHYTDEDGVLMAHSIGVPQSVKNKEATQ
ncbi:MAG: DUF5666 domain-containing protein [Verrucomicrobiia bacterium]|jgi:Cu/Ag efflux protein CusF